MGELASRESPLASLAAAMRAASAGATVCLDELAFLSQINLRGRPNDPALAAGIESALGIVLPAASRTTVRQDGLRALWLGPDEWLIVGPDGSQAAITDCLRDALAGQHVSIATVSASRTVLQLAGADARAVLEKGCLFDLHPRVFRPGHCVGTTIAKTQVFLEQTDDQPTYRLYVRCSFARHMASWVLDAMLEFTGAGNGAGVPAVGE